jgi:glucose-1-phosphatase
LAALPIGLSALTKGIQLTMTRPEFIYFDMGNVLCFFDRARQVRQVAEVSGAPEDKVREVLIGKQGIMWRYEAGELDDDQYYEGFCSATDTRPEKETFLHADGDIFELNNAMLPVVAHLEDAQIPLGILSNTSRAHWNVVIDGRFSAIFPQSFRKIVLSFEAKACKPDKKIFDYAIQQAGVAPEKIFFMDDTLGHVEAAKRYGIDAVQFTTPDALIENLLERGVRCNL